MPGTDQRAAEDPTLVQGTAHVRAARADCVDAPFVPDEDDADGLLGVLVPDLDAARPVLLQGGEGKQGAEVARFRATVRVTPPTPATKNWVPAEIPAYEHAGPASSAGQPSLAA